MAKRQREQTTGAETLDGPERGEFVIDCAKPLATEPTTKIVIAVMNSGRRP